jgi:hypothetical protein
MDGVTKAVSVRKKGQGPEGGATGLLRVCGKSRTPPRIQIRIAE